MQINPRCPGHLFTVTDLFDDGELVRLILLIPSYTGKHGACTLDDIFFNWKCQDFYYLQWLWRKRGICQKNVKEISYLCLWAWGLVREVVGGCMRGGPWKHMVFLLVFLFVCLFVHCKHLNDYCWAYILEIFFTSNCNKLNKCLYIQRKYSQNFLNWVYPRLCSLYSLLCIGFCVTFKWFPIHASDMSLL